MRPRNLQIPQVALITQDCAEQRNFQRLRILFNVRPNEWQTWNRQSSNFFRPESRYSTQLTQNIKESIYSDVQHDSLYASKPSHLQEKFSKYIYAI